MLVSLNKRAQHMEVTEMFTSQVQTSHCKKCNIALYVQKISVCTRVKETGGHISHRFHTLARRSKGLNKEGRTALKPHTRYKSTQITYQPASPVLTLPFREHTPNRARPLADIFWPWIAKGKSAHPIRATSHTSEPRSYLSFLRSVFALDQLPISSDAAPVLAIDQN